MLYETFLETVKQSMKERLGPEFTLLLQPITKNNAYPSWALHQESGRTGSPHHLFKPFL
uniref:hypothetical protein n=1 Tax=Clostridium sp. NkU-1 TaxID=1095009 RepID=UPI000A4C051C